MRLREGDPNARPIFVLFDATGDVLTYLLFAERLPGDRPVYGVRAKGLDERLDPDETVEDMAESAIDSIRTVQPGGTFTLVGNSFGGLVAYEAALRLTRSGMDCDHVVLLDSYVGIRGLPRWRRWRLSLFERPRQWVGWAMSADRIGWVRLRRRVLRRLAPKALRPDRPNVLTPLQAALVDIALEQIRSYGPGSYEGSVIFVRSAERFGRRLDPLLVWRQVTRPDQLNVLHVAGRHWDNLKEEHVGEVVAKVAPYLTE